jgi:hypothetical protein
LPKRQSAKAMTRIDDMMQSFVESLTGAIEHPALLD